MPSTTPVLKEAPAAGQTGGWRELFSRGAHLGYSRSRRHPSVADFIFGFKSRQAVIDLEKTSAALSTAADFLATLGASGKMVLWVGTKSEAQVAIRRAGEALGLPYVTLRWIGGTLTNHSEIKKRLARLAELETAAAAGRASTTSKRDWAVSEKERADLKRYFATIPQLANDLPAALVVVDSGEENIAVTEAKKLKIPIVALANTDCDIRGIDHPIVMNDHNRAAIEFFIERLVDAYAKGRAEAPAPKEPASTE